MLDWLRRMFGPKRSGMIAVDMTTGTSRPVEETDGGKLYNQLSGNRCPDCGHKGFFEGPSGGCSTNIYCMNPDCRQGFNVTPIVGTAERIGSAHGRFDHWYDKPAA